MRIVRLVLVWTLQVFAGAMFVLIGVMKFMDPSWARNFATWGYPAGFYMVVGVVEVAGGLALLVPPLTWYAALALMAVMVAAAATQLLHAGMRQATGALGWLVILGLVGFLRRASAMKRAAPRASATAVV